MGKCDVWWEDERLREKKREAESGPEREKKWKGETWEEGECVTCEGEMGE